MTPEQIDSLGKIFLGALTIISGAYTAYVNHKQKQTKYDLDLLYTLTYRRNPDGTPGPMRRQSLRTAKARKSGGPEVGPPSGGQVGG